MYPHPTGFQSGDMKEKISIAGLRKSFGARTILDGLDLRVYEGEILCIIGKSGTGKSFRAKLLAQKYGIELIVDDGLLIRDQKILAGRSAKKEKAYMAAVKTALFHDK
jgi:ABC-type transporter Mla maintaining outer membrane lipid asymmetry ATPase subunit MlaF